jgi:hypothetical protein
LDVEVGVPVDNGVALGGAGGAVDAGVAVGGMGVSVGEGDGAITVAAADEGVAVALRDGVAVGGAGVAVGEKVEVGGTGVSVDGGVDVAVTAVGTGVAVTGDGLEVTVEVRVGAASYLSVETGVCDGFGEQDGLPNRSHPPTASSAAPMNSSINSTPNEIHNGLRCTANLAPVSLERHVVDEQVAV